MAANLHLTNYGIEPMTIVALADNELLGHGLEVMLRRALLVQSVCLCATKAEAERAAEELGAEVLVMTSAQRERPDVPGIKVLLLLHPAHVDDPQLQLEGVDGLLIQNELTVAALDETLRRMVDGEVPIPPVLARRLLSPTTAMRRGAGRTVLLTPRETETLDLLAQGCSNKQVARRLGISPHGAKRLVASVLMKLGAPNRTGAVVLGIKAGLLPKPA